MSWTRGGKPWIATKSLSVQQAVDCTETWALTGLLGPAELCMAWLGSVVWVLEDSTLSTSLPFLLAVRAAWGLSGAFPAGLHSSSGFLVWMLALLMGMAQKHISVVR